MMSTRASVKRKRLNTTTVKAKKLKASRSSNKRPKSTPKSQSTTRSLTSTHGDSSLGEESLTIDSPDETRDDCESTLQVDDCTSKHLNVKKGPLNSSVVTKQSNAADELSTEAAYKKLQDVISICSPIVGRISNTTDRNVSSFDNNRGSVVLDTEDQLILPPPLSQITPTTNRISSSHSSRLSSRVNRPESRVDQHLTPTTNARTTVNRVELSSSPTTSCVYRRKGDLLRTNNNGLSNANRNIHGITKSTCASINTQPTSINDTRTNQTIASCSSINLSLLDSIPEYRNLKKELAQERQRCITWSEDYMKLRNEFEHYRASSFPRPSVDGLNFLLQLVDNLTISQTALDSRTPQELADAIGLNEEQLVECTHSNPQRAALQVFSRLYPTYHDRAGLINMKEFSKTKSQLLDDIFVFARQCNPSTVYSMERMRDAFSGSIRQARHQLSRLNNVEFALPMINNHHIGDENNIEQINDDINLVMDVQEQNRNNNRSPEDSDDEIDNQMDH